MPALGARGSLPRVDSVVLSFGIGFVAVYEKLFGGTRANCEKVFGS
jgi:hypothetical protein